MKLTPFEIRTSHLKIAGLRNTQSEGVPIIALHGWLDNAASFLPLSKYMHSDRPFFAIDLPGHGLSEHRAPSSSYHLLENIVDVIALIDALENYGLDASKVTLIGHSLGGIIASLVAASSPERIDQLILLDSMGPLTDETTNVLPQLRKAVHKASKIKSNVAVFPSLDLATKARMFGVGKLTKNAAALLVERGVQHVEGGYSWRSDPKLLKPSFLRLSEEQVEALFSGIECPVKLVTGKQGYFSSYDVLQKRIAYLKDIEQTSVDGGHHFHMDGDVNAAAELMNAYLSR